MTPFVAGVVVAVALAVGAAFVLDMQQITMADSNPTPSVRVGDPGQNLVGPNWDGRAG
jgi:hypothetical protein